VDWRQAGGPWGRTVAALVVLGALWLLAGPRGGGGEPSLTLGGPGLAQTTPAARRAPARYVVHVAGAVRRPGVYRVAAPGRLIDAVERAGGLTADADLTQVNLAARLTDGRQIVVPARAAATAAAAVPPAAPGAPGGPKLSLNAATAEQLQQLDGVGPAMAAAIVERRTELGGFTDVRQLDEVDGVGEKRLASLLEQVEL